MFVLDYIGLQPMHYEHYESFRIITVRNLGFMNNPAYLQKQLWMMYFPTRVRVLRIQHTNTPWGIMKYVAILERRWLGHLVYDLSPRTGEKGIAQNEEKMKSRIICV